MTRSRMGTVGLLRRHLAGGGAVSLLLPLLVAVSVLAIALAPRALVQVATDELRDALARESPLVIDLSGTGRLGVPFDDPNLDVGYLTGTVDKSIQQLRETLPEPLLGATSAVPWVARTGTETAVETASGIEPVVSLAIDLAWRDRVKIVEGAAPEAWVRPAPGEAPTPDEEGGAIEVAISRASATAIGIGVGDLLDARPAPLRVAAIVEQVDAADPYWVHVSDLATPVVFPEERGTVVVRAGLYIAPESFPSLAQEFAVGRLEAWIPFDPSAVTQRTATDLQAQVRLMSTVRSGLPFAGELDFASGVPELIDASLARIAAMSALIALSVSGLAGVLVAVLALAVRAVIARRAVSLRLAAARGAGELQLRGAMLLEGLLLSVPAGLAGLAIAIAVIPTPLPAAATALPVVVALLPAVLFAALTSSRPIARRRGDLAGIDRGRTRGFVELAIVGLAGVALVLLVRRGLVGPSGVVGIDPLLSVTPLLLAVVGCLVALRLYPLALRGLERGVRRAGDATAVVGAARAIRDPALGFATALALVVGVAVIVFSTVMATTVRAGLESRAATEVGADVRVTAPAIGVDALEAVRALDGVAAALTISRTDEVPFADATRDRLAEVVIADTDSLRELRADVPAIDGADGRVPVVLSSDWNNRPVGSTARVGEAEVVVAGIVDVDSLPGLGSEWVLVDDDDAARLGVELEPAGILLVAAGSSADIASVADRVRAAVTDALPGSSPDSVSTTDVATAIAETRTPIVEALEAALAIAAIAALALMMVTVVLASVAAAAARNRLLGVLRVIGMSGAQLRRILAWEFGPLAVVALVVGAALGLALPVLVTSVLDLRAFIGGEAVPPAVADPWLVLLVLAVFAVTVVAAAIAALALGRRLAPAGILRMGDPT